MADRLDKRRAADQKEPFHLFKVPPLMTQFRLTKRLVVPGVALALLAGGAFKFAMAEPAIAATATPAKTGWSAFRDAFLESYFKLNPTFAVYQGRHDFDGKLPDLSDAGTKARADFLNAQIKAAQAFDAKTMTKSDAFERDYLVSVAKGDLFWLTDADQPHNNPAYYIGILDPNTYIARNYADAPTRLRALITFLRQVPAAASQIRANLKTPMPISFISHGVSGFRGLGDYYVTDAKAAFASVKDPALQAQFDEAAGAASKAMKDLGDWLDSNKATATTDFALGGERFSRMLLATEMVDTPLAQLEAIGEADLKRNQDALREACKSYAPGLNMADCMIKMGKNKPPEGPVAARGARSRICARSCSRRTSSVSPAPSRRWSRKARPITGRTAPISIPPGRSRRASLGLLHLAARSGLDQGRAGGVHAGRGDLLFTSVHEVMPGHFLQFLHANRSPSLFGRLFVGYAFAEGWAHYAEEMMWDAGLNNGDAGNACRPALQRAAAQLPLPLGDRLHAGGMTQEQSRRCSWSNAIRTRAMPSSRRRAAPMIRPISTTRWAS
jgi:hypothetical protein